MSCSMKSFFGGALSTREACAIRSLTPEAPPSASTKAPAIRKVAPGSKPSSSAASQRTSTKTAVLAAQKRHGRGYMDFSSLDNDDATPSNTATVTPVGHLQSKLPLEDAWDVGVKHGYIRMPSGQLIQDLYVYVAGFS